LEQIETFLISSGEQIVLTLKALALPFAFFTTLAILLKKKAVFDDLRRVLPETRLNIQIALLDIVAVLPVIALVSTALADALQRLGLIIVSSDFWGVLPAVIVVILAVLAGDIIGYWRHRLEHTPLLWPSHAVHHSDTEMTWITLLRFHPINRLSTFVIDSGLLMMLGFPVYAVVANNLVRHYYGYLIHADLPWTYGELGKVFVSPVMHRWHHAADPVAFGTNYATVFAFIDRMFGTWRVPGLCHVALGVTDDMAPTLAGQMFYAFRPRAYRRLFRGLRAKSGTGRDGK
ncbi:MAG: sterol desaturase family protein, partial [Paracoccaceae bacterium]|nr:sterol desaturase family protein [Paracoccaceae bacterium]